MHTLGKAGGHKLLQSHNHTFAQRMMVWDAGQGGSQSGTSFGAQFYPWGSSASMNNTGGGDSQNLQPYRGLNNIIKV